VKERVFGGSRPGGATASGGGRSRAGTVLVLAFSTMHLACAHRPAQSASAGRAAPTAEVVEVELCSNRPYFAVKGAITRLKPGWPRGDDLATVAAQVRASGLTWVAIRSECWLTNEGVALYCSAFQAEGIRVDRIELPKSGPDTDVMRRCGVPY